MGFNNWPSGSPAVITVFWVERKSVSLMVRSGPWLQIVGIRNRLVHGYDAVDLDILWDTIIDDLPPLIAELEKILS